MSQQTSYTINHERGVAGQCIQRIEASHFVNESGSDMDFGLGVIRGTDPEKQAILPSSTGFTLLGFTLYENNRLQVGESFADGDSLSIIRSGSLYVKVEDAVTAGEQVYVRHTTTTNEPVGGVRSDADTDKADAVKWTFEQDGTAGSIVKIRHNPEL